MTKKSSFLVEKPSLLFLILGGFVCWFFAGAITSGRSLKHAGQIPESTEQPAEAVADQGGHSETAAAKDTVGSEAVAETAEDSEVSARVEDNGQSSQAAGGFYFKAGLIWGLVGAFVTLLMPGRVRLAYARLHAMGNRSPDMAALLTLAAFGIMLGLMGGAALSGWVLPRLDLPGGMVLKSGGERITLGCVSTAIAAIIPVPVAMRFVQTHKY